MSLSLLTDTLNHPKTKLSSNYLDVSMVLKDYLKESYTPMFISKKEKEEEGLTAK